MTISILIHTINEERVDITMSLLSHRKKSVQIFQIDFSPTFSNFCCSLTGSSNPGFPKHHPIVHGY